MKNVLLPNGWPRPRGYANGVSTQGRQVYVAGMVGWNAASQFETPLTYRQPGALEIAIGAFDDRSDLAPQIQVNYAVRLPWVEKIDVHRDGAGHIRAMLATHR